MTLSIKEISYNKIKDNIVLYKFLVKTFIIIGLIFSFIAVFNSNIYVKIVSAILFIPFFIMSLISQQQVNYNYFLLEIRKKRSE